MTSAFAGDTLLHRDKTFEMVDQPLETYFALIGSRPAFEPPSTQGRGYSARWLVEDGWLFLVSMQARWSDEQQLQLNHMFPFAGNRVFAAWYSGPLRAYRRDKPLPDLKVPGKLHYPDITLQIHGGRIVHSIRDEAQPANTDTPDPILQDAPIDSETVWARRATIDAGWDKIML